MQKIKKLIFCIGFFCLLVLTSKIFVSANTPSKVYFLGDSRFVGMSQYDSNTDHKYYCEVGKGYSYLEKYLSQIESTITQNDYLIINFGVNDLNNSEKYLELINKISSELECNIIYMTVNPVDEEKEKSNGYNVKNEKINAFNNYLVENSNKNIYMIDTNGYLCKESFQTVDGLHFTEETYKKILEYIENYIKTFKCE